MEHIIETSQKMYDEAKIRKLKIEEKKMNRQNMNDNDDSFYKYVKKIDCEPYLFDENENINYKKNNMSSQILFKKVINLEILII